ncbi:MAG: TatD family hydrolase [Candidatus Aenigmarchaeota archaeon]|nr:TatD family hydrolase [Candidatus Aenigmarchaeota archaeon]
MIDVHAHLCFPDFDKDMEEVIARCKEELAGVIVSSARCDEGLKALETCSEHPDFLFPTLGFHPTEGTEYEKVIELIKNNPGKVVGVGEVGLDYHWEKDPRKREAQKEIFLKFIKLAQNLRKPLVIHSWDAERDCYEMVKDSGLVCVFHCFSGDNVLAEEIVKNRDFYISISTQVLFSKNTRKIAKNVPFDQFLLETDAPFLSPNKDTDRRNYPWNIKLSARKIAELKSIKFEEVMEKAKENAVKVFDLKIDRA